MLLILGVLIVIASVLGGFSIAGGHLHVLLHPAEVLIILGSALGAFIIGNTGKVIGDTLRSLKILFRGPRHSKASYLELMSMLYAVFRLAKSKGDLALEAHVENPEDSSLFKRFPGFAADTESLLFLCDYLRLLTLGTTNAHEIETVMDQEIEAHHEEMTAVSRAVNTLADSTPALGIVAAVLGVIISMGSITEPPEVLGELIAAALTGTFLGVLTAYGFLGPFARKLEIAFNAETEYLRCMKAGILAHMQGYAPQIAVEFARKTLTPSMRPSFAEVEAVIAGSGLTRSTE